MLTKSPSSEDHSRVSRLATQLESDIRRKGLRVGDPYLTAEGASALLGVSRMTANRAMNVLAERQLLVRHRSRGTFVGPSAEGNEISVGKCIHYFTFVDDSPTAQLPLGEILGGLQESFPEVSLKTHLVSLRNAMQYVRAEIEQAKREPSLAGIVLALGTREIQQYLAESGLPVVVYGSVYPGVHLPSIDLDQKQLGRLLAQQALRAGYQRLVFVGREHWRRGDNLAFEGVQEVAQEAGLCISDIIVRNISSTASAIAFEIEHLLDEIAIPAAFICRISFCARAILEACKRRGLQIPEQRCIVCDSTFEEQASLPISTVQCRESRKEQFSQIGRMLLKISSGELPVPRHIVIPVEEEPAPAVG